MGTTRDSFEAGSTNFVWVVAVEGYSSLLCSGDTDAATVAWTEGSTLTKTGGVDGNWDAGAFSVESFAANGYLQTTAGPHGPLARMIGLSTTNADAVWDTIHFGLLLGGTGDLFVVESSSFNHTTTYASGDVLRIRRTGTTITYEKNGAVFYTSGTASTGALYVDTSFQTAAANVKNVILFDDGSPLAVTWTGVTGVTATTSSGTDWSSAIGGLFVEMTIDQRLHPDQPFQSGGSSCTLHVLPDGAQVDTFGIDVNRKSAGDETYLAATCDRDDTTIIVQSTAAFASSGTIHIGTEAIAYTGKTGTTFTGCTRGKWSPHSVDGGTRFAQHHRVTTDSNAVKLQPVVSEQPRTWLGRRVGVWAHRVIGGVLDTQAEAELVYAGRIAEIRDDPNTFATVVGVTFELDIFKSVVIGENAWAAEVEEGIYLAVDQGFEFSDDSSLTSDRVAGQLVVVASGASSAYEMNAGTYSLDQLCTAINAWTAAALAASNLHGTYVLNSPIEVNGASRSGLSWNVPFTGASETWRWRFAMPVGVARFLGFEDPTLAPDPDGNTFILKESFGATPLEVGRHDGAFPPQRIYASLDGGALARLSTTDTTGTFADQVATMPYSIRPNPTLSLAWGLFIIGDSLLVVAAKEGTSLTHIRPWNGVKPTPIGEEAPDATNDAIKLSYDDASSMRVRQILAFEYDAATMIALLMHSTGTAGYNESALDLLPQGVGAAVPYSLIGPGLDSISGATAQIAVIIDKPTKLVDLIQSDLMMRWAFVYWRNGQICWGSWRHPTTSLAEYTLDETNKAEPGGHSAGHRSATMETDEWIKSVIKIEYNRDMTKLTDGGDFHSSLPIYDRVAVDDSGGDAKTHTLSLRNTYSEFASTGEGVEALLSRYLTLMPLRSRPQRRVTRSINPLYFWRIGLGDVVLFTDNFARDPATGTRGITDRPALVTHHRFSLGGLTPADGEKAGPMGGEVELFFTTENSELSSALYAPTADIDYTDSTGSYVAGYNHGAATVTCFTNYYTNAGAAADATYFVAGDKVKVVERDPADLSAPIAWERTVLSQTGNTVTFTAALSSPAWDSTKYYRVIYDDHDVATTAQKAGWVFQADDGDGLILDTSQAFKYGTGSSGTYDANPAVALIELPELLPDISDDEGAPRDVGGDKQLIRLIENGIDYKTVSAPMVQSAVLTNTTNASGWKLVYAVPQFLGYEQYSSAVTRYVSAAPFFRSADGTSATVRMTLARSNPYDNTLNDVDRGSIYSSVEFTTTSATWQIPAAQLLSVAVKRPINDGFVWLLIECSYKAECRGPARFVEGPRVEL